MNCIDIETLCPLHLSGELDARRSAAFSEHLDGCRTCAEKLEEYTQLDSLLLKEIACEEINSAALDRRIRLRIASRGPSFPKRWLAAAACVAAAFLIGSSIHHAVFAPQPPRLCVAAAHDYHEEVILKQHRKWLSNPTAIAELAQRDGLPGSLIVALTPAGYHLEHGKVCNLDGRAFLHLVYEKDASRFSIYLRPPGQQLSGTVRGTVNGKRLYETEAGPEYVAYFQTAKLTAMFVTDQSSAAALSFARSAALSL